MHGPWAGSGLPRSYSRTRPYDVEQVPAGKCRVLGSGRVPRVDIRGRPYAIERDPWEHTQSDPTLSKESMGEIQGPRFVSGLPRKYGRTGPYEVEGVPGGNAGS